MAEISSSNVETYKPMPQNTLTIIGALENLGEEIASKSEEVTLDFIELFGKEVINLVSEGIEDVIEFVFPGLKDRDVSEITAEARERVMKVVELIEAINEDQELKDDVKMIMQLVTSAAGDMLLTLVNDMEKPIEEAVDKIQDSAEEIVVQFMKGIVRTTWDSFLAALDPIPIAGEIGGLVQVANSIFKTAVKVAPPAIENVGSALELGNNFVSTALNIGNENIDKFNEVKDRVYNVQDQIQAIQQRIAGKIQSAADGVAALGTPNVQELANRTGLNIPKTLPAPSVGNIKGSIGRAASSKLQKSLHSKIPKVSKISNITNVPKRTRGGKKSRARRRRGGRRTRRLVR